MHRFWSTFVNPLFDSLRPKVVIEVGCADGMHTRRLLEYCRTHGATLHTIDPNPQFDVEAWGREYGTHLVVHRSLSLNALSRIDSADVVLIDGDHNWYTVMNELRLIERQAATHAQRFPLVLLHDVGWPYGRRDLYYNPENIPAAFRQAYRQLGLKPDSAELQERGGLNPHLCNAVYEYTPQNGVLTAMEDFLRETELPLQFMIVPGLNGLGILFPEWLVTENQEFNVLLASFHLSTSTIRHMEMVEKERLSHQISSQQHRADLAKRIEEIKSLRHQMSEADQALTDVRAEAKRLESQATLSGQEIRRLQVALEQRTEDHHREMTHALELKECLLSTAQALSAGQANLEALQKQYAAREEELSLLYEQLQRYAQAAKSAVPNEEVERLKSRLNEAERTLGATQSALNSASQELNARLTELKGLREVLQQRNSELAQRDQRIGELFQRLERTEVRLSNAGTSASRLFVQVKQRDEELETVTRWMEQLDLGIQVLLQSNRWKVGGWITNAYRRLRGIPKAPSTPEHLRKILRRFRNWKDNVQQRRPMETVDFQPTPAEQGALGLKSHATGQQPQLAASTESGVARLLEQKRLGDVAPPRNVTLILYTSGECEPLRRALLSLRQHTDLTANFLYVIDDSQNPHVARQIDTWCDGIPFAQTVRPNDRQGYYRAVRSVMDQVRTGDFCVLRDTVVVTPEWLEGLKQAAYSAQNVGIVSPITNLHPRYTFGMNPGDNVMTCARKLRLVSARDYPGIFPDANVFYLRRQAVESVPFPSNPEDSHDKPFFHLVIELLKKGMIPLLADDTFVYTSRRFTRFTREATDQVLGMLHDLNRLIASELMEYTETVRVTSIQNYRQSDLQLVEPVTIGVLYSSIIVRGGVLILTEMTNDLILSGVDAKAILLNPRQYEPQYFDLLFEPIRSADPQEIALHLPDHSSIMATFWATAELANRVVEVKPTIQAYYFMQDFEVWFYDPADPSQRTYYDGAVESYHMNLRQLTTTDWIAGKVREFIQKPEHAIDKIGCGINLEIFYPSSVEKRVQPIRVMAMARPETPRRGFSDLMKALLLVYEQDRSVEICLFGSNNLGSHQIPFPYRDLGIISPERLRDEYGKSHIFVDASLFQGFGLAALEAMACGCACVVTDSGGVSEYAICDENALMVEPGDCEGLANQILRLIRDEGLRSKIADRGYRTAQRFSNHNVADNLLMLLKERTAERGQLVQQRIADETCNIVVPVHNQIHVVRLCLESIVANTTYPYRVYVVDDQSDQATAEFLSDFCAKDQRFYYLRNETNLGFVGSVNRGMAATSSGHLLLLNSDTIVTPGWLEKLFRCMNSDQRIGIVSPLSTTSSHLWIEMNPGDSLFDTARNIECLSEREYPDVVTPEGWCFLIHRKVYEHLGGIDPIYGRGYCEESDYSMRAYVNGYRLVCCDDTFIYHEGRVTFGNERGPRYTKNREIFDRRWKSLYAREYRDFLTQDPLRQLRQRYAAQRNAYLSGGDASRVKHPEVISILDDPGLPGDVERFKTLQMDLPQKTSGAPKVVFLLSTLEQNGGILSTVQLVNDMILSGIDTKVAVISPKHCAEDLPLLTEPIFFANREDFFNHFPEANLVVGTLWVTMYYMVQLFIRRQNFVPAYFVQDFEPLFYPESEQKLRQLVENTYHFTPKCFAKTEWICEQVRGVGGQITLVPPALDLDVFYRRDVVNQPENKVVLAMVRPSTAQRGTDTLIEVLNRLAKERNDFEVHVFGASDEELAKCNFTFPVVNHGRVPNNRLAALYSSAYVYLDFSWFHGFGRTIAEAMACGTPCVITNSGGVNAFAVDQTNCLMAQPGDVESLVKNLSRILDDPELRSRLASAARESIMKLDRRYSACETIKVFKNWISDDREALKTAEH